MLSRIDFLSDIFLFTITTPSITKVPPTIDKKVGTSCNHSQPIRIAITGTRYKNVVALDTGNMDNT
nr:hypothetical protein [Chengkuizengella sediminis]